MSTYRGFLVLPFVHFILVACATSRTEVPALVPISSGPQAIEFESAPPEITRAPGPYAPTRAANSPRYSWQSATQTSCDAQPIAKPMDDTPAPVVLTFSGPVGVFPLLPNEVLEGEPVRASAPLEAERNPVAPATPAPAHSPDFVVAALRPAFRRCFSHWLDSRADAEGSVRLALEVGCAGEVQAISADVQGVDEPTLECLFAVVGSAQFGPPANGHATLQVPVVFKNASR
ncbi:MAG TPA: hypothetical protein VER11_21870 [Polyangiaceae bacterium]|nr:hypothetical protein [Polyangiaceae bacterium]